MAELAESAKGVLTWAQLTQKLAQQVRLSKAGLVAHWRRQRHGGERAEQRRLTLRQWRRRELGSERTGEARGRGRDK